MRKHEGFFFFAEIVKPVVWLGTLTPGGEFGFSLFAFTGFENVVGG